MDTLLAPHGVTAAAVLLLLAGLAEGLGDRAVVLLINRITPRAFGVTLLASALLFAAGAALWIGGAWLAATMLFGVRDRFANFFIVLSFAYAPFLLDALALLGLQWWQALLCAACGTLLVLGVQWLFGEPAAFLAQWLWAVLAGRPRPLRPHLPRIVPGYGTKEPAQP